MDAALDYIQNDPIPDGGKITFVDMPPIVLYYYQDESWMVSFGLSYSLTDDCYDISIVAFAAR